MNLLLALVLRHHAAHFGEEQAGEPVAVHGGRLAAELAVGRGEEAGTGAVRQSDDVVDGAGDVLAVPAAPGLIPGAEQCQPAQPGDPGRSAAAQVRERTVGALALRDLRQAAVDGGLRVGGDKLGAGVPPPRRGGGRLGHPGEVQRRDAGPDRGYAEDVSP